MSLRDIAATGSLSWTLIACLLGVGLVGVSCNQESAVSPGPQWVSGDPPEWALQSIDSVEFDPGAWREGDPEVIWKLVCPSRGWAISGGLPLVVPEPFDFEDFFQRVAGDCTWAVSPSWPGRQIIIMQWEEMAGPTFLDADWGAMIISLEEIPRKDRAEAVALLAHHGRELIEPYL